MKTGILTTAGHSEVQSNYKGVCSSNTENLLTIEDISKYLSIKVKTIYAKVEAGEIPHYRIGRLIRFRLDEIDTWLDGCRKKNQPDAKPQIIRRRRTSKRSTDHIDKLVRKIIDEEKNKYYSTNHGKSDRIKGPREEINNGSI